GLPALARPARAVVPPPDGPPEPGVQPLLSGADPVAARSVRVPPRRAEAGRSPPRPADDVRGARRRASAAGPRRSLPAPRGDRGVLVERGGVAPSAGGGGPSPFRPGARAASAHAPLPASPGRSHLSAVRPSHRRRLLVAGPGARGDAGALPGGVRRP